MIQLVFAYPGNEALAADLSKHATFEAGMASWGHFPDGESKFALLSDVSEKNCVVVCSLIRPDEKLSQLFFFCSLLKSYGAKHITLLAPYLSYMRQDKVFKEGEGITAVYCANLISSCADALITVDAHLHRIENLNTIFKIPAYNLHAASAMAAYIKSNIPNCVLIGPDAESEQWVQEVAGKVGCTFTVLEKIRKGDRDVQVRMKNAELLVGKTVVLVDDIISTGRTMIETLQHLKELGFAGAHCVAVHAVFSDDSYDQLKLAGALSIVTCTTIPHQSNGIMLSDLFAEELHKIAPLI